MKDMDESKKNLIKIGGYAAFLLIIIVVAAISNRIEPKNNNTNTNVGKVEDNPIIETINNINENYYSEKVYLTLDDDAISLEFQKINEIEMGLKKYHKTNTEYTKHNDNYYKLVGENFIKMPDFTDFDYDKTFINITNIKELLKLSGTSSTYYYNDLQVLNIEYNLQDVLRIYNDYNKTNIIKYNTKETVSLEIYYKNDTFEYIIINTTSLYNLVNETNLENVIYKISLQNNKEEDTSWILDKLN